MHEKLRSVMHHDSIRLREDGIEVLHPLLILNLGNDLFEVSRYENTL